MLKDLCFEVIQTCPNKCKFCSSNSSQESTVMIGLEHFKNTINYFLNNGGIKEVSISGGEPFLHLDLFEMISFCKSNGIRTVIFTSGIKKALSISDAEKDYIYERCNKDLKAIEVNEPWNEKLKQKIKNFYDKLLIQQQFGAITKLELYRLKELGLDKIVFDLQALDPIIDNELMGRKVLNTYVMNSLIRASQIGLNVDVHFIPMKPNYKQFPDIIECLEIAGVKNISILNFIPQGRGFENKQELMLNQEELKEFSEIMHKSKEYYSGNVRVGIALNEKISHMCTAGTEKLDIKYDGTILPCPAFKEMSVETMEKYGIKLHSIYEDLESVVICGGKRKEPLCKKIYGFNGELILNNDERV